MRRLVTIACIVFAMTLLGCDGEVLQIRVHAIPLSNSDSTAGRDEAFTVDSLSTLIDSVNWIFDQADIELLFDPATDWEPMANTVLNGLNNRSTDAWPTANAVAAKYPNKLVVFFRYGDANTQPLALRRPTGNGFGNVPDAGQPFPPGWQTPSENLKWIAMPNQWRFVTQSSRAPAAGRLGAFFAHELGHHFGLFHTFPGRRRSYVYGDLPDTTPARQYEMAVEYGLVEFLRNGGSLDGDLISDTPPDPGDLIYAVKRDSACAGIDPNTGEDPIPLLISGVHYDAPYQYTFQPMRHNIMGYTGRCSSIHTFTPLQIQRMRQTLSHPRRRHLLGN